MMLIWKLLRKHVSALQLAGFFVTNLAGVAIILTAVQLYRDVKPAIDAPDSFMSNDYLILSKRVEGAVTGKASFSPDELREFESKPFVASLGEFTPARYNVVGGISVMGMGFDSYLFFESVPDRFLDVASDEWRFTEGDPTIPIIVPRNYLNLYNFGFASTQGLPQVSEQMVSSVSLRVELSGNGRRETFTGRIVAFSNRLNTILVPESFIRWSNERFGDRPAAEPSRVIVEVPNSTDEELSAYLAEHRYIAEGDRPDGGRASYLLRVATGVVAGVGLLITALSLFVLMLSIFLLLQKNTRKLEDLLLTGYTPAQVSRPYRLLTLGLNVLALACAVPLVMWACGRYLPYVSMLTDEFHAAPLWPTLLWGLAAALAVTLINYIAIGRKVAKLWWQ